MWQSRHCSPIPVNRNVGGEVASGPGVADVECVVDPLAALVGVANGLAHFLVGEVEAGAVLAHVEALAAKIDGVGAGVDHGHGYL